MLIKSVFAVFYPLKGHFYMTGEVPGRREFEKNYRLVFESNSFLNLDLDYIFTSFNQSENPLATSTGQDRIKQLGVSHTSMSVGDVIFVKGKFYIVRPTGFQTLYISKYTVDILTEPSFKITVYADTKDELKKFFRGLGFTCVADVLSTSTGKKLYSVYINKRRDRRLSQFWSNSV